MHRTGYYKKKLIPLLTELQILFGIGFETRFYQQNVKATNVSN